MKSRTSGGIIISKKGDIYCLLCVKQWNNLWSPPKGRVEINESVRECAQREIKEETGVMIPFNKFICIDSRNLFVINGDGVVINGMHNRNEILNVKWIPINNLMNYKINTFLRNIYKRKWFFINIYNKNKV